MSQGKAYSRTCAVCGVFGPCERGYNAKWTPDNPVGVGPGINPIIELEREAFRLGILSSLAPLQWPGTNPILENYQPDESDIAEASGMIEWAIGRIITRQINVTPDIEDWRKRATQALQAAANASERPAPTDTSSGPSAPQNG